MTDDLPEIDPEDLLVNAVLDGEADDADVERVMSDPELSSRLDRLIANQEALADVKPLSTEAADDLMAAIWGHLDADESDSVATISGHADGPNADAATTSGSESAGAATVTHLGAHRARRFSPLPLIGAAAAVVAAVAIGVGALGAGNESRELADIGLSTDGADESADAMEAETPADALRSGVDMSEEMVEDRTALTTEPASDAASAEMQVATAADAMVANDDAAGGLAEAAGDDETDSASTAELDAHSADGAEGATSPRATTSAEQAESPQALLVAARAFNQWAQSIEAPVEEARERALFYDAASVSDIASSGDADRVFAACGVQPAEEPIEVRRFAALDPARDEVEEFFILTSTVKLSDLVVGVDEEGQCRVDGLIP